MYTKKFAAFFLAAFTLSFVLTSTSHAATVTVKCESRSNRAKISIDGKGYGFGLYRARAASGAGVAWAKAFKRPVGGQLEFDFDSNLADVRAGATYIPATFIKNRTVNGRIYSYNPVTRIYKLIAMANASCSVKK